MISGTPLGILFELLLFPPPPFWLLSISMPCSIELPIEIESILPQAGAGWWCWPGEDEDLEALCCPDVDEAVFALLLEVEDVALSAPSLPFLSCSC